MSFFLSELQHFWSILILSSLFAAQNWHVTVAAGVPDRRLCQVSRFPIGCRLSTFYGLIRTEMLEITLAWCHFIFKTKYLLRSFQITYVDEKNTTQEKIVHRRNRYQSKNVKKIVKYNLQFTKRTKRKNIGST